MKTEQFERVANRDILASVLKWYYKGCKMPVEDISEWGITEITKEQFDDIAKDENNDLEFARRVIETNFPRTKSSSYSMFIKYSEGIPKFFVVRTLVVIDPAVYVYVEGGESFGNWLKA